MAKIMIVEDNERIRIELSTFLTNNGYGVVALDSFDNVVFDVLSSGVDCLLLDLNLPNIDGHYIAKQIRKVSNLPIIVITSRSSNVDELMSINIGADDFISKPYDLQILLARLESLLRRVNKVSDEFVLAINGLTLDLEKAIIYYENFNLDLTKNELLILSYLIKNKNKIVSRNDLMNHLWGGDSFIDENTLTVNINRLRNKLADIGVIDLIETKRSLGYIINEV